MLCWDIMGPTLDVKKNGLEMVQEQKECFGIIQ
jgi:hypothetical protein